MNVFVLNTGRCGSTTFIKACRYIENYTCAHESRAMDIGPARLDYGENHIEADNRLSWVLGRLDQTYGKDAFYVHLRRNDKDTARSFSNRYGSGIIEAYRKAVIVDLEPNTDPIAVAHDYCDTVNSNIEFFLKDKPHQMNFHLENSTSDFRQFWSRIDAAGDIDAALHEFTKAYNPTRISASNGLGGLVQIPRKLWRLVKKFPAFVREA